MDLGLQQALLQAHRPSPAAVPTKANTLKGITRCAALHIKANTLKDITRSGDLLLSKELRNSSLALCKELTNVADCFAVTADEADDIEVDLGLQQALLQSHGSSPAALHINASPVKDITHPAALHTKANTLKDITNWNLPIPAPVQAQKARVPTPLMALAGKAGTAAEAI